MSKKILVVDDNPELRKALSEILKSAGYETAEAENGKVARELLHVSRPDLIVSDYQMPFLDGLELLKFVKGNIPTPFILVTAFGHILETQQAFEAGADDFFTKPFKSEDILTSVKNILFPEWNKPPEINLDEAFCRIPIEDFVSHEHVRVNIHVRLSQKKYVRVAHKGDKVPLDRVENYKSKGLAYLYAQKNEFASLVGFNINLAESVRANPRFSFEKKARFIRYTTETVLENIAVNGIDSASFEDAKECMKNYMSLISESFSLCEMLTALNNHGDWIYAHSLGVSVYSIMIGKKMGWNSSLTFFKLGLSGLLHDIGHKEIDSFILEKPRPLLTQNERQMYETHPSRGREILESLREVPGEVLQVVIEHHENCHGQGYPRRVTKERIHPLAKIVSVADQFCYETLKTPFSEGADAYTAITRIEKNHADYLDDAAFNALRSMCLQCTA